MIIHDFITELFCRVDDKMADVAKHPQSNLWPSEIVTLGLLFALKGVSERAFYRWASGDLRPLFPRLPSRTRLFRLFKTHQGWTGRFLAEPSLLGVIDTYGIELIHPVREGRSERQIGKKGMSNRRWIVGGKLCFIVNHLGLVVAWASGGANVYDAVFHPLINGFAKQMLLFADVGFHSRRGDPPNLKVCPKGHWNVRMLIETVLSMLTNICHFKKLSHRVWAYFNARLAFTMAMFNVLAQWHGLPADEEGFIHLSIAEFSL